jgi:DNA-binding transcriptional LysR family regulator
MDLDGIAIFVKVLQAGNFSRAAKLLGMPNSTVSAKVAALEKRLGVTLLQRTTRRLRPTQAGAAYFERSVRALEELQAAEHELESARGAKPHGRLRVTAPVDVGHRIVPALVHQYLEAHPQMELELIITNRVLDLVSDGIDLAVRAGTLKDSGLIARRFELGHFGLWASPDYLAQHPAPRHPKELTQHQCLRFAQFKNGVRLTNGKDTVTIPCRGRLTVDDLETLRALALYGMGIAFMPSFLCAEENKQDKLARVLPQWRGDRVSLSLVYPAQRFVPAKVRAFIAVAEQFWKK